MATVGEALSALGITEWVLRGEPTTEEEFNEMDADGDGSISKDEFEAAAEKEEE